MRVLVGIHAEHHSSAQVSAQGPDWSVATARGTLVMAVGVLFGTGHDGQHRAGSGGQSCDGAMFTARPLVGHAPPVR
jgi:hypothetical protein